MGSDLTTFGVITLFFIALGVLLPFIESEFDTSSTSTDIEGLTDGIEQDDATSFFGIIGSVFNMFYWTFGQIPFLMDLLLFIPLRIILAVVLAKWIRGIGG